MRKPKTERNKSKILLYSALISLMLSGNNLAIAKDVTVSSGNELLKEIKNATEPTKIQFANDIDISGLNIIPVGSNAIEIDGERKSLINEKDSRFTFVKNSSLALKNLKYVGKNASINVETRGVEPLSKTDLDKLLRV